MAALEKRGQLSARDNDLLRYAAQGLSAEEIGAAVNLPPAAVLLRVKEILSERNPWTVAEERQLLLDDMKSLKMVLMRDVQDGVDDKMAGAITKTIGGIDSILDKIGKVNKDELEVVTRAQATALLGLLRAGMERAKELLKAEFPELPADRLDEAFDQGLQAELQASYDN